MTEVTHSRPVSASNKSSIWKWLEHIGAAILAGIFVWAAIPKIASPQLFAESINNYRLLPPIWASIMALVTPPIEVVTAMGLLWPKFRQGSALIMVGMLMVFSAAMFSAIQRGVNIECGCFGSVMKMDVSWLSIARNVALSCLTIPIWYRFSVQKVSA